MSPIEQAVLDAIRAEPGLHPKQYWQRTGLSYGQATSAARRLVRAGLVKRTGQTNSARYWPVS